MIIDLLKSKKFYLFIFVILLATLPTYYFYRKYQNVNRQLQNLPKSADERINLVEKIGKLIKLPEDEVPLVATVTDEKKLENQPFFKDAKIGDKVLVYSKAKQAFLYRPSTNKIINVGPVNIEDKKVSSESATILDQTSTATETPTLIK